MAVSRAESRWPSGQRSTGLSGGIALSRVRLRARARTLYAHVRLGFEKKMREFGCGMCKAQGMAFSTEARGTTRSHPQTDKVPAGRVPALGSAALQCTCRVSISLPRTGGGQSLPCRGEIAGKGTHVGPVAVSGVEGERQDEVPGGGRQVRHGRQGPRQSVAWFRARRVSPAECFNGDGNWWT